MSDLIWTRELRWGVAGLFARTVHRWYPTDHGTYRSLCGQRASEIEPKVAPGSHGSKLVAKTHRYCKKCQESL